MIEAATALRCKVHVAWAAACCMPHGRPGLRHAHAVAYAPNFLPSPSSQLAYLALPVPASCMHVRPPRGPDGTHDAAMQTTASSSAGTCTALLLPTRCACRLGPSYMRCVCTYVNVPCTSARTRKAGNEAPNPPARTSLQPGYCSSQHLSAVNMQH